MPPALPPSVNAADNVSALLPALLADHSVWRLLDASAQAALAPQWQPQTTAPGDLLLPQGELHTRLGMVLAGSITLRDPDLDHAVQLQRGQLFGFGATPERHLATWQARAATDGAVAWLAPEALQQLCRQHSALEYHFPSLPHPAGAAPAAPAQTPGDSSAQLHRLATPVRSLLQRSPVHLSPDASIRTAAEHMRAQRVSSVLLVEDGLLTGLVTDRDLRSRVLAEGLDSARPLRDIATLAPHTLQASRPAFEALLLMARANIHHVPVLDGTEPIGMVTANDLAEQQSTSAVALAGDIHKHTTVAGLAQLRPRIRALQRHLAEADTSAHNTGQIVTAITDALTVRLVQLAELQLGPAPVPYVWVAAGSQARSEQTAQSDQDNCLVMDDRYDAAAHGAWFSAFARFVCDGLDACGYVHCPGDMMAMTDRWRQPRARWVQYFREWIDTPDSRALMLTCVFFDLRAVHGQGELLESLRREVLERTRGNSLFLAHMVGNALKHRPPLGLFGTLARIRGGAHAGTIDLKHSGVVPIVDLARLFALAGGAPAVNTQDRLEGAAASGEVSVQSARDLGEALEFISRIRIRHQARQLAAAQAPDNFLALQELSNFERSHLKQAFSVVHTMQGVLGQRYRTGH